MGGGCIQGGSASRGSTPRGGLAPEESAWGGLHLGGSASRRFCMQGSLHQEGSVLGAGWTDPPSDTTAYGKRAGGVHSTGMHSCP